MQDLLKRSVAVLALVATAVPAVSGPARADPVVVRVGPPRDAVVVRPEKVHRHRHAVGHRFRPREVVVIRDWRARGLPRPGPDEVYVIDRDDIYLVAAATLAVKALIN